MSGLMRRGRFVPAPYSIADEKQRSPAEGASEAITR